MTEYEQIVVNTCKVVVDTCEDIQLFIMAVIIVVVFWALYKFLNIFF